MSAAATLPDLPPQPGPAAAAAPSRFAPLLSLVDRIIEYGKQLAATLRNPTPDTDLHAVASTFGSYDFAQILASIVRGLHRACALEARLTRLDALPAPEPKPATVPAPRAPRAAAAPATKGEQPTPILIRLPTPEQIARRVNSQPIGVVLADICRDLGIMPNNPLWQELFLAIILNDGSAVRLSRDISHTPWLDPTTRQPITAGVPLFNRTAPFASTGPPA